VKGRLFLSLAFALVVMATSVPLLAHHGNAAFDTGKKLEMKGTVTEWIWANPHCWLKFDVKDDSGKVTNWVAESNNAADMLEKGWSKQILKTGDAVTVTLEPVKNGNPVGRLIQVLLPDGHMLGMAYLKR
jgi:Family of unknown function (DUF6152)